MYVDISDELKGADKNGERARQFREPNSVTVEWQRMASIAVPISSSGPRPKRIKVLLYLEYT